MNPQMLAALLARQGIGGAPPASPGAPAPSGPPTPSGGPMPMPSVLGPMFAKMQGDGDKDYEITIKQTSPKPKVQTMRSMNPGMAP